MTSHRIWILVTSFVLTCFSSFHFHAAHSAPTTGWEDLEMKAVSASGELQHLNKIQLRAWTAGYYEKLPTALEFSWNEPAQWTRIETLRHFSLECDTFLTLGKSALPPMDASSQESFREDAHLIISLKSELYSRCDMPIVYPWTFKLVLKTAADQVLGEAEFRGQPHRMRRPRQAH
jgi:hypothetical protein